VRRNVRLKANDKVDGAPLDLHPCGLNEAIGIWRLVIRMCSGIRDERSASGMAGRPPSVATTGSVALAATVALESPNAKRERAKLFAALYEDIRDQLAADVSKSAIIKALADGSMSISNAVFDELLTTEAKRRGEPVPGKDDEAGEGVPAPVSIRSHAPQAGAKEEVNRVVFLPGMSRGTEAICGSLGDCSDLRPVCKLTSNPPLHIV
jgi:hypothetical protein